MGGAGRLPGGRGGGPRAGGRRHRRAAPAPRRRCPRRRARAARASLDGPWIVRGDRAGRGEALGWRSGAFAGRTRHACPSRPTRATCAAWPASARSPGSVAWYRTTVIVPRAGVYAIRFESVNHRAVRVGRRAPRRRSTPAPTCPSRRACASTAGAARARRARRLAQPGGDEGRRLASHVVQLRRRQPAGVDPRARAPASSTRRRSSPAWTGTDAVVDVAVGVTNRAGAADDRRARHAGGRGAALPGGPSRPRRARDRPRPGAHRAPRPVGARPPDAPRPCASRSPASRSSRRASACARCAGRAGGCCSTASR